MTNDQSLPFGAFDYARWKAQMAAIAAEHEQALVSCINDGGATQHYLIDEPFHWRQWGQP